MSITTSVAVVVALLAAPILAVAQTEWAEALAQGDTGEVGLVSPSHLLTLSAGR